MSQKADIKIICEPPQMSWIKTGTLADVQDLLNSGFNPNQKMTYEAEIVGCQMSRSTYPLAVAISANRKEIVTLLLRYGAQLPSDHLSPLELALKSGHVDMFLHLLDLGFRINNTPDDVYFIFFHARHLPDTDLHVFINSIAKMNLSIDLFGGKILRSVAGYGQLPCVTFLVENGADINYHQADNIYPYASSPIIHAAYENHEDIVRYLAEHGADVTYIDKNGDRPYTLAVKNRNKKLADYLKDLEPSTWHCQQDILRKIKTYKIPQNMAEYLQEGSLCLEFPQGEFIKRAELYSLSDTVEITWRRKKLLSLVATMENYDGFQMVWNPNDRAIWFIDREHEIFSRLCTWEELISDPGTWVNDIFSERHWDGHET